MDSTVERAARTVLADLVENGGGTYERGTLLPFTPQDGYMVAIGGLNYPAEGCGVEWVQWAARVVSQEWDSSFVGTWLNEGKVYMDAVEYFSADRYFAAMARAKENGQAAIYNFGEHAVEFVRYDA